MRFLTALLLVALTSSATAQLPNDDYRGVTALGLALRELATTKRVLVIAAHPDDEDSQLISVLSLGQGAAVAYLSLTRGEGGQNSIGEELGPALGILRTGELLVAEPYVAVNWATKVDLATGRPVVDPSKITGARKGNTTYICPSLEGGKSPASPAAFSPRTGWFYSATVNLCMNFEAAEIGRIGHARMLSRQRGRVISRASVVTLFPDQSPCRGAPDDVVPVAERGEHVLR